jgi:uncharacterized membrane protein YkvA (DUF1232 family)
MAHDDNTNKGPLSGLPIRNPIAQRVNMIGDFVQHIRLSFKLFLDGRVPIWHKAIPVLAIAYIISPIDLIPEVLLGVGVVDDIMLLSLALDGFLRVVPAELMREHAIALGFEQEDTPAALESGEGEPA